MAGSRIYPAENMVEPSTHPGGGLLQLEHNEGKKRAVGPSAPDWPLRAHNSKSGFDGPGGGFEDGPTGRFGP
jgi:hypothetical protein